MICALLMLLATQTPELSAPPSVEASTDALAPPTPPAEPPRTPASLALVEPTAQSRTGDLARMTGTFAGVLLGMLPAVAGFVLGYVDNGNQLVVLASIMLLPASASLGGFLGHRLSGGNGTYGKALSGTFLGAGLGLGAGLLCYAATADVGAGKEQRGWASFSVGLAVAAAMTLMMLEYSHGNETQALQLAIAPLPNGGALSIGGALLSPKAQPLTIRSTRSFVAGQLPRLSQLLVVT